MRIGSGHLIEVISLCHTRLNARGRPFPLSVSSPENENRVRLGYQWSPADERCRRVVQTLEEMIADDEKPVHSWRVFSENFVLIVDMHEDDAVKFKLRVG